MTENLGQEESIEDPWDEYDRITQERGRWAVRMVLGMPILAVLALVLWQWSRLVAALVWLGAIPAAFVITGFQMSWIWKRYRIEKQFASRGSLPLLVDAQPRLR